MNFFIWWKNVCFSKYLDFSVFVKCTNFKICDVIMNITAKWKLHFCLFLWNSKHYQNEIRSYTSVHSWFNLVDWKLVPGLLWFWWNGNIIRICQPFSSWYLPFLILPYSSFQKNETLKTWHNWLLSNWSMLLN